MLQSPQIPTVALPASKSISNRVLILNALSYSPYEVQNLAVCDDTQALSRVLDSNDTHFDVGDSGTAFRFLTAFLAKTLGEWTLTGSPRMQQRPIAPLVDALRQAGAKIEYMEREGFPPLRIFGSALEGGTVQIDGTVSSQFVSALMMVAPYMLNGLHMQLQGELVSRPYVQLTAALMKHFGVQVTLNDNEVHIAQQTYAPVPYTVEADWTAASYWYEWLAVRQCGTLFLPQLRKDSLQGDARVAEFFARLGVQTHYRKNGVLLSMNNRTTKQMELNLVQQPDLAQTMAVTCCLRQVPFRFTGLATLRIKETDRLAALVAELAKLGFVVQATANTLTWQGERCAPHAHPVLDTYNDHRMAMAFASAALLYPDLTINDKNVVRKSYPDFWTEMDKLCTAKSC